MEIEIIMKPAFCVIGREGSTDNGPGFVQDLWADANERFNEVAYLGKRDENGGFMGFWGAMTDFSRRFQPWEDHFSRGLYLAGVESAEDAEPPEGWVKWQIPGFRYLRVGCDSPDVFGQMLAELEERGLALTGAVQDFTDPATGRNYMLFPIERLD